MRRAYQVDAVRAAERALMDLLPDGTLMNRAAAGLAAVCGSLLARYPGHVYGARVVVLAGSGDNGRVLVRPSGTEPAIRLMVQAADAVLAEQVIDQLAAEVRLALAGQ